VKTFAVIAIGGFVIFLMTAVYLLRGGGSAHVMQPPRQADPQKPISGEAQRVLKKKRDGQ
jgi:hypothetical protein